MAGFLKANQAGALGLSPGDKDLVTIQTPDGAKFRVARQVAPQFNAFLTDLHGTGYKLNPNKSGGYNYRTIAGTPKLSQHAYGNAIDLNWDKNPYGSKRFDLPANVGDIAAKHGIVWGGTWKKPDPMHFEVSSLTPGAPASEYVAANAVNEVATNGAPMATPIGGAPIAGGPVPLQPLTPPSDRRSKLADMLLAQAAGAKVSGWGDALRAAGGAALGYSMGNQADKEQGTYRSKLAEMLSGSSPDNLATTLLGSGDEDLMKAGVQLKVAQAKPNTTQRFKFDKDVGLVDEVEGRVVKTLEELGVKRQHKLEVADKKEIFEADEGAQAATNVMSSLDKAISLNDKAYSGPAAQTRGYVSSLFGGEGGVATEELQNVVLQQVLDNLKATFGAAPTEGERQILVDIQGSVNKSPEVRKRIFEGAKAAAERRLKFNQERSGALRSGDYYNPGYSPLPAPAPDVATPPPPVKTPPAAPTAPAIQFLKSQPTPEVIAQFDAKYGPGSAQRVLGAAGNAPMVAPPPAVDEYDELGWQSEYGVSP